MSAQKISLLRRFELHKELQQQVRAELAQAVRVGVRRDIAEEVAKAQAAITVAEEQQLKTLPSPLPAKVAELIAQHPVVAGRHLQLRRLEESFAPARLEHAESIARAIEEHEAADALSTSAKAGRKPKSVA